MKFAGPKFSSRVYDGGVDFAMIRCRTCKESGFGFKLSEEFDDSYWYMPSVVYILRWVH